MAEAQVPVAEQFDDAVQQRESAELGIWIFLVGEVLFFGALFITFAVYRMSYHQGFEEASRHLYESIGATNTAILLTSSLLMALAVHASNHDQRRRAVHLLAGTVVLGGVFLLLKATEYYLDYREDLLPPNHFDRSRFVHPAHAELFLAFYWIMTVIHAIHVLSGASVLAIIAVLVWRARNPARYRNAVENAGLFWHLVDIIWIFLFPLLYLLRAHP